MSRIQVYARIRQSEKGETGEKIKLQADGDNSKQTSPALSSQNENSEGFDRVFESSRKAEEIYTSCLSKLINPFLEGCNVGLLVLGEADSGQVKTVFGGEVRNILKSSRKNAGLLTLLVSDLFAKRGENEINRSEKVTLKLTIVEIMGNDIKDLMDAGTGVQSEGKPGLAENEVEGTIFKNVIKLEVVGAKDCLNLAETSLSKASFWEEDVSANNESSTLMIQFEMTKMSPAPLTSWLRIFKLSSAEKLMLTPTNGNSRSESSIRDIHSFGNMVMHLSECDTNYKVPNYRESLLTTLMSDVLGGNCYTNCLVTFKPIMTSALPIIKRYALRIKKIINYPNPNTLMFKNILRRYRWMMRRIQSGFLEDKSQNKAYVDELKQTIAVLETRVKEAEENAEEFKAQTNSVKTQLANASTKFAEMTSSRTDMSSRMVSSEQDKLKLSKEIVDLKIMNNTIKQEAEKQVFHLKQKNLNLEEKVSDLERHFALEKRGNQDNKERFSHVKKEFQDLSEEYVNLKGNYTLLSEEHQNLVKTNEKLMEEIANLADSKDQILKHKDNLEMQQLRSFTDRLKVIAKSVSEENRNRKKSSTRRLRSSKSNGFELGKQLLYSVQEREEKLDTIREEHNTELKMLEDKMVTLKEDLKDSLEQAERYKTKMAEQNSELLIANEQKKQLEEQYEKLDEKFKQTSHEYIVRLEKYISDIKEFVQHQQGEAGAQGLEEKLQTIQNMVDGLEKAYKSDNDMLESKVKRLTACMHEILQRHEQLLTAYKLIMWKTGLGRQSDDSIERDFAITLPPIEEIEAEQIKERRDLKTKLYLSEQSVGELQSKVDTLKDRLKAAGSNNGGGQQRDEDAVDFSSLRRDMRNFTVNVQVELEKERAELMTRCTLAEQQVAEYEEYMETYIQRYQHEITRLRRLLSESGRIQSADNALAIDHRAPKSLPPLQDDWRYRTNYRDPRY